MQDLLDALRGLEADYPGMPPVVQKADLVEINRLRERLGLFQVDSKLQEIGTEVVEEAKPKVPTKKAPDHSEARGIYEKFLARKAELKPHLDYADRVAKATAGGGMTPVKPLATMGTKGGPLLCDHCGKAIVLEGGNFHNKTADVGWKANPVDNWVSYILGGMVVEIALNGTLRIYHGYPGQSEKYCCNAARAEQDKAEAEFKTELTRDLMKKLHSFLLDEFPKLTDRNRDELLNEIVNTLYDYDPGIGVNRPEGT